MRREPVAEAREGVDQRGAVLGIVQQDDPLIYLYRQRNLTGFSEDVVGVSTYADGVVRLSRAAFVDGADS